MKHMLEGALPPTLPATEKESKSSFGGSWAFRGRGMSTWVGAIRNGDCSDLAVNSTYNDP